MSDEVLELPLRKRHQALEAKWGLDAQWEVPLSYGDVLGEYHALAAAGLVDVSNRGRLKLRGDDALGLLERLCTHDVAHQEDDTAVFTLLCNDRGGVISQAHLARLEGHWMLLTPAMTRTKVAEHLVAQSAGLSVKLEDQTPKTAEIILAGRAAAGRLDSIVPFEPSRMEVGQAKAGSLLVAKYLAARLDIGAVHAIHVTLPAGWSERAWDYMMKEAGRELVRPVGHAALDALRIEQGVVRYGHELNETIDPLTAGLEASVDLTRDWLGAAAVREIARRGPARRRVGLVMEGSTPKPGGLGVAPLDTASGVAPQAAASGVAPMEALGSIGIPRLGDAVLSADGAEIGAVTSGTMSPSRGCAIAMAYVNASVATAGAEVRVQSAAGVQTATIVMLPFA